MILPAKFSTSLLIVGRSIGDATSYSKAGKMSTLPGRSRKKFGDQVLSTSYTLGHSGTTIFRAEFNK